MKQDSTDPLTTYWTDDKHRSYLTFMEENFVKDMYEREYCAVDVCGHGAYPESRNTVTHHQPSNILEVLIVIQLSSSITFHVFGFRLVYTCVCACVDGWYMCMYYLYDCASIWSGVWL